jgi:hypothetical protein
MHDRPAAKSAKKQLFVLRVHSSLKHGAFAFETTGRSSCVIACGNFAVKRNTGGVH